MMKKVGTKEASLSGSLFFLFAELGVDLEQGGDDERHGASGHHDEEECAVADGLLQGTSEEAGNHHREGHQSRTKRVVGRLVLALAIIYKVEHVGGEAKAVAKLLEEHADIDYHQALRQGIGEIDIDHIGQRDGADHRPQPVLQAVATGNDTTEDAAQREADDSHRALHQAVFGWREAEATFCRRINQEQGADLSQQTLGHAVEEHETDADPHLGLVEEGLQRLPELLHDLSTMHLLDTLVF